MCLLYFSRYNYMFSSFSIMFSSFSSFFHHFHHISSFFIIFHHFSSFFIMGPWIWQDQMCSVPYVASDSEDWTKDGLHRSTTSDFHFRVEGILQDICCDLLKKGRVQLHPDVCLASGSSNDWGGLIWLRKLTSFVGCIRHRVRDVRACSRWMQGMNMGICVSRVPTPPFLWGPYFPAQTSICTLLHHSGTAAPHLHVGPRTSQQDPSYLHFKTNLPLCYLPSSRSSTVLRPTYYVYAACTYVLPVCVYIYISVCVHVHIHLPNKYYSMSYLHTLNIQS